MDEKHRQGSRWNVHVHVFLFFFFTPYQYFDWCTGSTHIKCMLSKISKTFGKNKIQLNFAVNVEISGETKVHVFRTKPSWI